MTETATAEPAGNAGLQGTHSRVWDEARGLPLVVEPEAVGTDLAAWLRDNRDAAISARQRHGAVLFRGFDCHTPEAFEAAAKVLEPELKDRYLGTSPRSNLTPYVFTSVELPAHYPIPQHAEMSFYYDKAPKSLFFWCGTAPDSGGPTPVTDLRGVYRDLDPAVRERFEEHGGVRHIRGYSGLARKPKLDVFQFKSWDEVFGTDDRAEVERTCAEVDDEPRWGKDGSLTLYSTHPAFRTHPETGEVAWYNHLQVMHLAATPHELARQAREQGQPRLYAYAALLKLISLAKQMLPAERQSWHVTYADGTEIANRDVRHVCDVIWRNTAICPWRAGDVLALDNASVAHGRTPFTGERLVAVAWA